MAVWIHELDLWEMWNKKDREGLITIKQLAQWIAKKIRSSSWYGKLGNDGLGYEIEEIADNFEACGEDEEEFNEIMTALYDWGDTLMDNTGGFHEHKKLCWIRTRF